jgi:hypothetical protein
MDPRVARSINFLRHLIPMNREFVIERFEIDFDNFIDHCTLPISSRTASNSSRGKRVYCPPAGGQVKEARLVRSQPVSDLEKHEYE